MTTPFYVLNTKNNGSEMDQFLHWLQDLADTLPEEKKRALYDAVEEFKLTGYRVGLWRQSVFANHDGPEDFRGSDYY